MLKGRQLSWVSSRSSCPHWQDIARMERCGRLYSTLPEVQQLDDEYDG